MESPQQILEAVNGYQASRIILTAVELRVFSVLKNKMMTSGELSEKLKCDERNLERLLNALCTLELCRKKNNKFYNTPAAQQFLVEESPDFMAGLMHTNHLWDSWTTLTEVVQTGKKMYSSSLEWSKPFIQAMHYRGKDQAKILKYMFDFNKKNTLLDLGGGSGAFSIEFVQMKNDLKAVVFDLPGIIPITKEFVRKENSEDKISFIEGNYLEDDIGSGYDLVFLSAIVHSNSFDQNQLLVQKCFNSLNPGGEIVIVDYIMSEDRLHPPRGTFFAINMLVNTDSGDTFTFEEISGWLIKAGFNNIEKKDTGFGTSMVSGIKR